MNPARLKRCVFALLWLGALLHPGQHLAADAGAVIWWGAQGDSIHSRPPIDLTNVVSVLPDLALKSDGTLVGWGESAFGQRNIPAGLSNVVAIAQGHAHRLALKADGTVVAWGAGTNDSGDHWTYSYGQSIVPAGLTNVVAVAAGSRHSLALRANGSVAGWGFNYYGQTDTPADLTNAVAIAAGTRGDFNVALRSDGTVTAWGCGYYGETNVPAGLSNVVAIAAGDHHGLALRSDGTVRAWGQNEYGQIDLPTGLDNVIGIAAGWSHSLALKADGTVVAWGVGFFGQTNVPWGLTNATAIAAGRTRSLAVNDGSPAILTLPRDVFHHSFSNLNYDGIGFTVTAAGLGPLSYQWQWNGTNISGATNSALFFKNYLQPEQSGSYRVIISNPYGQVTSPYASLQVTHSEPIIMQAPVSQVVSPGWDVTFEASVQGSLPASLQWRLNGTNIPGAEWPRLVLTNVQLFQEGSYDLVVTNAFGVAGSPAATLTVLPSAVLVWGDNGSKQRQVTPGLTNVLAIATGAGHCLALKSDGTVAVWGTTQTYGGQSYQTNPPAGLSNVVAIAAGFDHSLALTRQGAVVAWGGNWAGQADVPTAVTNAVALAAGGSFSLALKSDGTITAWGAYSEATNVPPDLTNAVAVAAAMQYGFALKADGTPVVWPQPFDARFSVPVGLNNVVAIAAGYSHFLALKSDGTVAAWGVSYQGMGGPVTPPDDLADVVAIAAGGAYFGDHSLALRRDGTIVAWGSNEDGQTDVPSGLTNVSAIAAGGWHSVALSGTDTDTFQAGQQELRWTNGCFMFSLPTRIGRVYRLEYKDSLADSFWRSTPLAAGIGDVLPLTDPAATNASRFYRVGEW